MTSPTLRSVVAALVFAGPLASLTVSSGPPARADGSHAGRAVVYELEGTAERLGADPTAHVPVSRLDWLPGGATLRVGKGARARVALASGRRFELRDGARLELLPDGSARPEGRVVELPSVPPIPRLQVRAAASPSTAYGVRVRQEEAAALHPSHPEATVADETELRFTPPEVRMPLRVCVEEEGGTIVFEARTDSGRVAVPPGALKAGRHYWWSVRSESGLDAYGRAAFWTVSPEVAAFRAELLRRSLQPGEEALTALLADVDRLNGIVPGGPPDDAPSPAPPTGSVRLETPGAGQR